MAWIRFLVIAVIVVVLCLGGLAGWLLPRMGVDAGMARIIGGALGGVIVAVLYQRMRPDRAA
jgi:peptidoglycan/LPS O-acetylase OafA/YrhL